MIGTAGHIDHGKTSIVKALTGTDTDTLNEEKKRGMTIDIGFAYLNSAVTIIDVPGHEKFIRNMVAGVSTIDIALIVVSADDGLMPQTHEHIDILNLLDVKNAFFAITKVDMAEDSVVSVIENDIRERIKITNFSDAKIFKTSTKNGQGIEKLKDEILSYASDLKKNQDKGIFYMPIDRVFSKKGFGTIVTGTVLSGKLEKNSEIEVFPGKKIVNVRSFQTHGKETSFIKKGDRAAINLLNVEQSSLKRGCVLVDKARMKETSRLIAHVKMISNGNWKIVNKQLVHIHIGTSQVVAKAITYGKEILPGESANILFDLSQPIAPLNEQKFIIRSISPMKTIAGGTILETNPQYTKKELKKNIQNIELESSKRFFQLIKHNWRMPLSIKEWAEKFNISEKQIKKWVDLYNMLKSDGLIFTSEALSESRKIIFNKIEHFHSTNKYKKNFPKEDLLSQTGFSKNWFECVVSKMRDEVSFNDAGYSLVKNEISLSNEDSLVAEKMESFLLSKRFDLQSSIKIYPQDKKKCLNILYVLKDKGRIVQIGNDLWMHNNYYKILKKDLKNFFIKNKELSVPMFKEIFSVTRKNAIPLLEYCDKIKFTERIDNYRFEGAHLNE